MQLQQDTSQNDETPITTSEPDAIQKWFYAPIEEQPEHRGFTILLLIIPIYERYLRHVCNHGDQKFYESSLPISQIMADTNVSREQANQFWQIMRNGLCHRGTPKQGNNLLAYAVSDEGPPVSQGNDGVLVINPYAIRPLLLKLFKSNPGFWSNSEYPVPDEIVTFSTPQRPEQQFTQTRPHI